MMEGDRTVALISDCGTATHIRTRVVQYLIHGTSCHRVTHVMPLSASRVPEIRKEYTRPKEEA